MQMPEIDSADAVSEVLQTWGTGWPRRSSQRQEWVDSRSAAVRELLDAETESDNSPFLSVYSFPRGHPSDGRVPEIDTLFLDLDIENGDYERGSGNRDAWQRDLSHLLVRVRAVAQEIQSGSQSDAWRASLSGHKGIHLFLDFQRLNPNLGEPNEFIAGLNEYATQLIDGISEKTGMSDLSEFVDVTSSDLSRLCRVPNTLHEGATESFGEERYCVPVSLSELVDMTPEKYENLTRERRPTPWQERHPLSDVTEVINQYVALSEESTRSYGSHAGSDLDWGRVDHYRENSNDSLTLDDVKLLTSDMPCVWEFHLRDDKFQHGNQSHEFETHAIAKLVESNFPIRVIKSFFSNAPEYDEEYTEQRIEELIARDFKPYSTEKLLRRAPEYTGYSWCARCQRVLERNPELQ